MLANNKPIHPAQTIQQTARAAAVSGSLSRADFKQPKLDKRNVWTPISNINQQDINHNQTIKLASITNSFPTTTPSSAQRNRSTTIPLLKQKSQQLTDMLKAKLQEGRMSKKSVVDVDLPESNLRLVFDLNNLDKLQTQQTQESTQKVQRAISKTNSKPKSANLVAGTKGGVKSTNSKGELKSVREQLRLMNDKNQINKTTTSTSAPQHFHIGYIRASDLRKVINSGFSMNDMPTDISNNQTERPISARLVKPAPAKIQSKTSPPKANLEENDLESISQRDISSVKVTSEKKATRKAMISPKQAHFGLRDKKSQSANLLADTKSPTKTAENETGAKANPTKANEGSKKSRQQQLIAAGIKGGAVNGKSKRPSVSSRSVPFSTTTSPTTLTPTTSQPTTQSSIGSSSPNIETESEGENDNSSNQEGTTTISSLFARMAASFSSMTTTSSPTTNEQNSESSATSLSVTTSSPSSSDSVPSSANGQIEDKSQTTNSPVTSANLISSNDQQQKDIEAANEESNSTDDNDDEDQNNSLAAEQLNTNYGGFGTRNRLLQRPNSTKSAQQRQAANNAIMNNLIAGTKSGANRAVVSVQPLNLKTSAFVVEDSQQSTTTNNNDNEGLIEVKDDGSKSDSSKTTKQEQTENDQQSTATESSADSKNNNNGDEVEFTLISNSDQKLDGNSQSGKLDQGVLIQRTSSGKAIRFAAIHNNSSAHSAALRNSDDAADDYEDGFEDVNEIEIVDTSKPTNAAGVFQGNGAPLIIRPFPLSATCACAPLTTINNALSSGTTSQSISKRLRILAKELGAENLFNKFPLAEQHLQKRLETIQSSGKDGYTLFLPSDEALERLPLNLIRHWETKDDEFTRMLDNHIVQGEPKKLAHLLEARTLTSIANNNSSTSVIRFNHYRNDTFTANGQRVIYGDQPCPNNGVLHILDGMLYPLADKNILETLKSCNKFDGQKKKRNKL